MCIKQGCGLDVCINQTVNYFAQCLTLTLIYMKQDVFVITCTYTLPGHGLKLSQSGEHCVYKPRL